MQFRGRGVLVTATLAAVLAITLGLHGFSVHSTPYDDDLIHRAQGIQVIRTQGWTALARAWTGRDIATEYKTVDETWPDYEPAFLRYRPLTYAAFYLFDRVFGNDSLRPQRVFALLVFLATSVIALGLIGSLTRNPGVACLATLLYTAGPFRAWILEPFALFGGLYLAMGLLAIWLYGAARRTESRGRALLAWSASWLCALVSMLLYDPGFLTLAAILWIELYLRIQGTTRKRGMFAPVSFVALGLCYVWWRGATVPVHADSWSMPKGPTDLARAGALFVERLLYLFFPSFFDALDHVKGLMAAAGGGGPASLIRSHPWIAAGLVLLLACAALPPVVRSVSRFRRTSRSSGLVWLGLGWCGATLLPQVVNSVINSPSHHVLGALGAHCLWALLVLGVHRRMSQKHRRPAWAISVALGMALLAYQLHGSLDLRSEWRRRSGAMNRLVDETLRTRPKDMRGDEILYYVNVNEWVDYDEISYLEGTFRELIRIKMGSPDLVPVIVYRHYPAAAERGPSPPPNPEWNGPAAFRVRRTEPSGTIAPVINSRRPRTAGQEFTTPYLRARILAADPASGSPADVAFQLRPPPNIRAFVILFKPEGAEWTELPAVSF